jgi:anti-sigma factor RsiW
MGKHDQAMNDEELMIQALDGAISTADRARLDAYFATHPDARAVFERMLAVDTAMRETPIATPPADFSQRVMASAQVMPIVKPLKPRHVAAIVAANSMLIALAWLFGCIAMVAFGAFIVQQPIAQPAIAFVRGVNIYVADAYELFAAVARSLVRQPIVWITMLFLVALVAAWLSVLAKVLMPTRRYTTG